MTITIQDNFPLYCLINVSGGSSATKYSVTYLDAVPSGGWTTTHKTNYIVMRWCPAGTYMMQGQRKVTLTKPFWSPDKVNATVGRLNATVFPRRAFSLPDVHLTCT